MAFFNFVKSSRIRRFNYEPRYYDERKEALEKRIRQIENEVSDQQEGGYQSELRKGFTKGYFHRDLKRRQRNSVIRLIIILALLLFIFYFIFAYLEGVFGSWLM